MGRPDAVDAAAPTAAEPVGGEFTDREPVQLPSLGVVGWARWAWTQLTSMRTALLLLFLLAVAAVPGSMLPQRREDVGLVSDYLSDHPTAGPWLDRLGFFDVYSSPWFSAIYLLLFVSLVGCVIPRARLHWRAVRSAPPRTPRNLARLATAQPAGGYQRFETDAAPERVLAAARAALRRPWWGRYKVADGDSGSGSLPSGSLAAERGYAGETGNLVFHLALLGVLISLAWGSLASYHGQAVVIEGKGWANALPYYDDFAAGPLVDTGTLEPFSFTLDDFTVVFESQAGGSQMGSPREFDARLTVKDSPSATPRPLTISPNHPLDVRGTRAFLVGNGYAPVVRVTDGNGKVAFEGPVITRPQDSALKSTIVIKVPDAAPRQIGLVGVFLPSYELLDGVPISTFPQPLNPKLLLLGWVGAPGKDSMGVNAGVPESVFRIDTRRMTQLTGADGKRLEMLISPGATADLPGGAGTVTFTGLTRYVALDIRHDPSKGWALVTSMLALAGVTMSLFVRRRRVWVRAAPGPAGRTVVEVAGLARGEDGALAADVARLAEALGAPGAPSARESTEEGG